MQLDSELSGSRAHRALALMGAAAVVLAAVAGFYLHATAPRPGPPPVLTVTSLSWLSPSVGWVVLTDGQARSVLFHTDDGGDHWERQFATVGSAITVRFLDTRHGLMTEPTPFPGSNPSLLRTDDGGDHWGPIELPFGLGSQPILSYFADLDHGWLMVRTGRSDTVEDAQIYRTENGGLDWTVVASVDPISWINRGLREEGLKRWIWFRNAQDGWIGSLEADGSASVYVTHDGGAHWRWERLPEPPGGWTPGDTLVLGTPRISDGGAGELMLVDTTRLVPPPSNRLPEPRIMAPVVVYRTTDGGDTWADPVAAPAGVDPRRSDPAFVDGTRGWLTAGGAVFGTSDSGRTWERRGRLEPGRTFATLTPVDGTVAIGQSATAPGSPWTLVVTEDAGRTWRELTAPKL
jgi:photosystem II stability/assembly factor-like uncharacterized protein